MPLNYFGVKIAALKGNKFDSAVKIDGKEWSDFLEHVCKCIDRLRTIPTGRKILDEIRQSGHTCTIFSAGELWNDPNVATKWPPSLATDIAACVRPFRPRHKNLTLAQATNPTFVLDHKSELLKINELKKKKDVARELLEVLERAKAKFPNPLVELPPLIGITTQDLLNMCLGNKAIDNRTYYLLCFRLYDYLTPGAGCDSVVRFSPYDTMVRWCTDYEDGFSSAGIFETVKRRQRDRMSVILGHELIHCWRMMRGRRIVTAGWEEEGMTAGVGPFLGWPVTENQLRKEFGLPLRIKYAQGGACSDIMTNVAGYLSSSSSNYQIPDNFRREQFIPHRF